MESDKQIPPVAVFNEQPQEKDASGGVVEAINIQKQEPPGPSRPVNVKKSKEVNDAGRRRKSSPSKFKQKAREIVHRKAKERSRRRRKDRTLDDVHDISPDTNHKVTL